MQIQGSWTKYQGRGILFDFLLVFGRFEYLGKLELNQRLFLNLRQYQTLFLFRLILSNLLHLLQLEIHLNLQATLICVFVQFIDWRLLVLREIIDNDAFMNQVRSIGLRFDAAFIILILLNHVIVLWIDVQFQLWQLFSAFTVQLRGVLLVFLLYNLTRTDALGWDYIQFYVLQAFWIHQNLSVESDLGLFIPDAAQMWNLLHSSIDYWTVILVALNLSIICLVFALCQIIKTRFNLRVNHFSFGNQFNQRGRSFESNSWLSFMIDLHSSVSEACGIKAFNILFL